MSRNYPLYQDAPGSLYPRGIGAHLSIPKPLSAGPYCYERVVVAVHSEKLAQLSWALMLDSKEIVHRQEGEPNWLGEPNWSVGYKAWQQAVQTTQRGKR
ncbi:MAG: hypothetical protein RL518_271 [Pseudomonadota bacterium]